MSGNPTEQQTNGRAARPGPLDTSGLTAEGLNARSRTTLPGLLGVEIVEVRPGVIESRLDVRPDLLAPNGFLHGGTVVALADTACGYGCAANLPEGGIGFATVGTEDELLRHGARRRDRLSGVARARRAHNAGVGRRGDGRGNGRRHRAVPLHADGVVSEGVAGRMAGSSRDPAGHFSGAVSSSSV